MIDTAFDSAPNKELNEEDLISLTAALCGLPKILNQLLFKRIDSENTGKISKAQFQKHYETQMQPLDVSKRIFTLLAKTGANSIVKDDFKPLMKLLMETHPGLDFLKATPEFQEKYGIFTGSIMNMNRGHGNFKDFLLFGSQ
jgi:serine/threonine-protein phosphatase 2A regulatory subunit B''